MPEQRHHQQQPQAEAEQSGGAGGEQLLPLAHHVHGEISRQRGAEERPSVRPGEDLSFAPFAGAQEIGLADGNRIEVSIGGKVVKNVTGYDLCKLLAGSWGTLSVLTKGEALLEMMIALGYDAMGVGNHEFDEGFAVERAHDAGAGGLLREGFGLFGFLGHAGISYFLSMKSSSSRTTRALSRSSPPNLISTASR